MDELKRSDPEAYTEKLEQTERTRVQVCLECWLSPPVAYAVHDGHQVAMLLLWF